MYNGSFDEDPGLALLEEVMSQSFENEIMMDGEIPFSACRHVTSCVSGLTLEDTDPRSYGRVPQPRPIYTLCQPGDAKAEDDQMIVFRHDTGKNIHICIKCGMSFDQSGACMTTHRRLDTGETPYHCRQCSKTFSHLGSLKTHQRIHTGESPFHCKLCDKSFNVWVSLKTHLRFHTGGEPFPEECDEYSSPTAARFSQPLCWTAHLEGGPKTAVHVAVGHKVYAFGRYRDRETHATDKIPVYIFNTVGLHWTTLPPATVGRGECPLEVPAMRSGHTAVLVDDIIYVWGGCTHTVKYCNVLYAFDVRRNVHKWFKPVVSGTVSNGRQDHSACVSGKAMYIYGGWTEPTGGTNDIYKVDTASGVWSVIITSDTCTPVSDCHSATIIGTKMFVFGGWGDQGNYYNTTRVFDTETNRWLSTPSAQLCPERRRQHSAFTYNGDLYIFGGFNFLLNFFNDLWKFNPETLLWTKVEVKEKGLCSMYDCCCLVGDRVVFLGGCYTDALCILDFRPRLKTLCKLAVIHLGLEQSELRHDIRCELAAMTKKDTHKQLLPE